MRIHEIINEGYKEAQSEFGAVIDPAKALELINQYKVLCQRNQVVGQERNIDYWRKQGVGAFARFVQQKLLTPSKTEIKRSKIPGKHIDLVDNSEWQIVIPLDKESSCFHGKNSDWCTTKPNANYFEKYFYDNSVTLIYLLKKQTSNMWAIACHTKTDQIEMFDQQDKSLNAEEFKNQTGINPQEIRDLALSETHATPIQGSRDAYQESYNRAKRLISDMEWDSEPSPEIEKELEFNKHEALMMGYFNKIEDDGKNSVSDRIKLLAVSKDGTNIRHFENPSEKMKMTAVQQDGLAVYYIDNPSEEVQLSAVRQRGFAIKHIENPSEEVKLAAVRENGNTIRCIKNPSIEIQVDAVWQDWHAIEFIKNPSIEVQLGAVRQNWHAIEHRYIENPSEEAKLAAVRQNGLAIKHIENPSDEIKMAAVQQDGYAIEHIENPSEEVKLAAVQRDGYVIVGIENPSEKIKMAAVQQCGYAIQHLDKPSEEIQLAAVRQNGYAIQYLENPSEAVQIAAVRQNWQAMKDIKNSYTNAVKLAAEESKREQQ